MAAKILKGSNEIALGDFRGEIEILRRVHHPNAVQVRRAAPPACRAGAGGREGSLPGARGAGCWLRRGSAGWPG